MKGGKRKDEPAPRTLPIDHAPFFKELEGFAEEWTDFGLTDDDLKALQMMLAASPLAGKQIRGSGGVRKIRYSAISSTRGKSGGYRVFYLPLVEYSVIVLMATLSKADRENVTASELAALAEIAEDVKNTIRKGRRT